jgi:dihydrofolate reductase
VEWLDRPRPKGDYGMGAFWKSVDTIVMGRKTYDFAVDHGGAKLYGGKDVFVFTRQQLPADPDVTFVSGSAGEFARSMRARKGKDVWLMGGGELIASFLDDGAVDEFVIAVIPVLIGEGIPLIAPRHRHVPLELLETKPYEDGVVTLRYAVGGTA